MQRATVFRYPSKKVCFLKLPPTNLECLAPIFSLSLPSVQEILFGISRGTLGVLNQQQMWFLGEAAVTGVSHHHMILLHLPPILLKQVDRPGHALLLAMVEVQECKGNCTSLFQTTA